MGLNVCPATGLNPATGGPICNVVAAIRWMRG